jgi:hypothetical protein
LSETSKLNHKGHEEHKGKALSDFLGVLGALRGSIQLVFMSYVHCPTAREAVNGMARHPVGTGADGIDYSDDWPGIIAAH